MKKNLILLTSLIPLGISTIPFVTSCNPQVVTGNSIKWDFNKDGQYKSRIPSRKFANPITQEQANNIYLQEIKQNPYIFIDDYMVCIDTAVYAAKQYDLTLKTGTIDLEFNITSDNYVTYKLKANFSFYQGNQPYFTLDADFEMHNVEYRIFYQETDLSPIMPTAPRWLFCPMISGMASLYFEYHPYISYFETQAKQWFINGEIKQWDLEGGQDSIVLDINNQNFHDYDDHDYFLIFFSPLMELATSKYLSNAKIKEDFTLDTLDGDYIKCSKMLSIDTAKSYIAKIDMSQWDKGESRELGLYADAPDYDTKIIHVGGLRFISVNNKITIEPNAFGNAPHFIDTSFWGLKKDCIVYTNFSLTPKTWGTIIDNVELKSYFNGY